MSRLNLEQPEAWPEELRKVLDELRPIFRSLELGLQEYPALTFDEGIRRLGEVLKSFSLRGYHFTRLTDDDAGNIRSNGLEVLSTALLDRRINGQVAKGTVTREQAQQLLTRNQAHDSNRSGKVWFCFYPAHEVSEHSVRPLLGHWGGEALYNINAADPELGPVLKSLGRPALVEADVPVTSFSTPTKLSLVVSRLDLIHQGIRSGAYPDKFEDYAIKPLAPSVVRRVLLHPGDEFIHLTQCQQWHEPLT